MVAQTHIRTDKETLARLRKLAGDMPVTTYLREVVSKVGGDEPSTPIEDLKINIIERLNEMNKTLKWLENTVSMLYNQGQDQWAINTAHRLELDALIDHFGKTDTEVAKISDIGDEFLRQYRWQSKQEPIEVDAADEMAYFENDESESE